MDPAVDAWADGLLDAIVRRIDSCLLDEAVAMGLVEAGLVEDMEEAIGHPLLQEIDGREPSRPPGRRRGAVLNRMNGST